MAAASLRANLLKLMDSEKAFGLRRLALTIFLLFSSSPAWDYWLSELPLGYIQYIVYDRLFSVHLRQRFSSSPWVNQVSVCRSQQRWTQGARCSWHTTPSARCHVSSTLRLSDVTWQVRGCVTGCLQQGEGKGAHSSVWEHGALNLTECTSVKVVVEYIKSVRTQLIVRSERSHFVSKTARQEQAFFWGI